MPLAHGIMEAKEPRHEELPPALAGADLHRSPGGGRTGASARNRTGARGNRFVAATTAPEGKARPDCGLRGGNGGYAIRPRSRLRGSRNRAPGKDREDNQMKRGEVYWADLVPRSGSEQTGRRPVILVSHD